MHIVQKIHFINIQWLTPSRRLTYQCVVSDGRRISIINPTMFNYFITTGNKILCDWIYLSLLLCMQYRGNISFKKSWTVRFWKSVIDFLVIIRFRITRKSERNVSSLLIVTSGPWTFFYHHPPVSKGLKAQRVLFQCLHTWPDRGRPILYRYHCNWWVILRRVTYHCVVQEPAR